MKVCFISSFYPPLVFGGAEIYVRRISEHLVRQGIEVTVITTGEWISLSPKTEYINGVKVCRIHPLNIYPIYHTLRKPAFLKPFWYLIDIASPHSWFVIKKILAAEKPDIVHVHNFKGFPLAFHAAKSLNLPLVFTIHDYFLECPKENLFTGAGRICTNPPLTCRLYRRIQKQLKDNLPDLVTAPSQFVIDKIKEDGFFAGTRTMKLPLGIEETGTEPCVRDYTGTISVLFVGRLNRFKGVDTLIDAFRTLSPDRARLHIVGGGAEEAEFRARAAGSPAITFHGFVSDEELAALYRQSHVLVVPSVWYETFGIVIIEGFRHGLVVVASNIGGFPELVKDKKNGLLFAPGDAGDLRKKLEDLIADPGEMRRMSDCAYAAAKEYGMDEHIATLTRLYTNVITAKSPAGG